jgi:hypothetical protein
MSDKELDEMIAEKVMKWIKKELPNNDAGLPYTALYWVDNNGEKMRPVNFFTPSFDIEQAIKVAETFDSWQLTKMQPQGKYRAIVKANGNVAFSDKPAIAICLACLKAVGVEVH